MSLTIPIKDGDWNSVRNAIRILAGYGLGVDSTPTFSVLTLSGLTASLLVQTNADKALASVADLTAWIAGTTNRVTVANDTDGTVTLSAPQDIHAGATPTFAGLHINSAEADSVTLLTLESDINNTNEYNEILFKVTGGQNYGAIRSCIGGTAGDSYMSLLTTTDGGTLVRQVTIQHDGKVGFGTFNPETLLEMVSTAPYLTLHNITHEDTDGGGESRIIGKREDGNGTETACFQFEASHDGSGVNDQLGKGIWSVNTGSGLVEGLRLDTGGLTLTNTSLTASGESFLRVTGLQVDGTAMTGTLRGAYIDVSNGSTAATGTIRGMELKARTEAPGDSGNDVNVLEGLSISADSKDHSVTTMRAAEFILDGSTGGTITEAVGLRIANNLQANKATTSYGLQIYRDSFDYTADIQLSGGGTIGGLSGVMKLSSAGLLEVINSSGTQFRLSHTSGSVYADFTVASDGDLRIQPTGHLEFYTANGKDIEFNSADDMLFDCADTIKFEAEGYFTVDCDKSLLFEAGERITFYAVDEIRFQANRDSSDYIQFQTAADVPEITTVGTCDLKITASSGEINFDNENLATTGRGCFGGVLTTNDAKLVVKDVSSTTDKILFKSYAYSQATSGYQYAGLFQVYGYNYDAAPPNTEITTTHRGIVCKSLTRNNVYIDYTTDPGFTGLWGYTYHGGYGIMTGGRGLDFQVIKGNTGPITNATGIIVGILNNNATGAITTAKGIEISTPVVTGTITTNYGLYIDNQTGPGTTYSIYSAGGQSVHAGNVRIGSTTNPTNALDVTGASTFGGSINYLSVSATGDLTFAGSAGFYPVRLSQSAQPTPDTGELVIWRDTDDNKTYIVYNDTDVGVRGVEMI